MRPEKNEGKSTILAGLFVFGIVITCLSAIGPENIPGSARLISIQQVPELGEMCLPESPSGESHSVGTLPENLFFALQEPSVYAASQEQGGTSQPGRLPIRKIRDTDPIYSYVAVDTRRNEVFMQDANTWSIRVFNRLDNTPPYVPRTNPKRVIEGPKTNLLFNTCIYIDPKNGDIYSVENDIGDSIVVFSEDAEGNVEPIRELHVTHRAYAMVADEEKQELFVSVQYPPAVEVYRKTASGNEKPLRVLHGESTRLSDSHGIAIDEKRKLLFVNNWGHISDPNVVGTGRFEPASISVYPLDAKGDTSPLRVIQGPKTQLNWPGTMSLDPETGDLYVANDVGNTVLVFRGAEGGDVPPARILKGNRTGLSSPVGVFVDAKNKELWVANLGNASATVYPLTANGNTPPVRTIRSAPAGKVSLKFGKTQTLVYDSKREEILVPNWVVHPQIAAFARLAKENTPPVRTLEGQKTLISRTMHGFGYDAVHDEIVVTGPLTQAILIFRGGANGEEPPLRVIQGPHTQILGTAYGGLDRVSVDGVHGEIYLPIATGQILVFAREANGDVTPKRILNGARGAITVDPVHDLLIVNGRDTMAIYDRTASGDAKPKAVIQGSQSRVAGLNTVQVSPAKGLIIGGCDRARHPSVTNAVCAWNITDNGNVPPRWAIPIQASTGGYQASGIAVDPVHKEIIVSAPGEKEDGRPPDGTVNNILTFSWPEIF